MNLDHSTHFVKVLIRAFVYTNVEKYGVLIRSCLYPVQQACICVSNTYCLPFSYVVIYLLHSS